MPLRPAAQAEEIAALYCLEQVPLAQKQIEPLLMPVHIRMVVLPGEAPRRAVRQVLDPDVAESLIDDPLAARRPEGGLFMWSEQYAGPGAVTGGRPEPHNTSAAAVLSYDVPHRRPWDWRVSLYTWTKGIAAGAYLPAVDPFWVRWRFWAERTGLEK